MLGFYEQMADFAAMSENDGFLGRCATEIAEPLRTDERKLTIYPEGDLLRRKPRQLKLLAVEDKSRVT